jgi:2-polyprenyl-3-methyl-5-hydroxy-6-metoxy-1,4-benzoquinol methylase
MKTPEEIEKLLAPEAKKYELVYSRDRRYGHDCFGTQVLSFISHLDFNVALDIGSGGGEFAGALANLGKNVSTIDICPAAVLLAARNPKLHCMEGHVPGLQFDAIYDLITAFDVLEHVPPDLILDALQDIRDHCSKHFVASIAWTGSVVCSQDLHPCKRSRKWWLDNIGVLFSSVEVIGNKPKDAGMTIYARC